MISRPAENECAPYYGKYIARVPDGDVLELLDSQHRATQTLLAKMGEERGNHRYESGKWSVKEVIGHLTDTERVFSMRALVFARNDSTPQPGMEQDDWVANANFHERSLASVANEFAAVRAATMTLFHGFAADMWERSGTASECPFTARSIPFIIAGHERHHIDVIQERYMG